MSHTNYSFFQDSINFPFTESAQLLPENAWWMAELCLLSYCDRLTVIHEIAKITSLLVGNRSDHKYKELYSPLLIIWVRRLGRFDGVVEVSVYQFFVPSRIDLALNRQKFLSIMSFPAYKDISKRVTGMHFCYWTPICDFRIRRLIKYCFCGRLVRFQ